MWQISCAPAFCSRRAPTWRPSIFHLLLVCPVVQASEASCSRWCTHAVITTTAQWSTSAAITTIRTATTTSRRSIRISPAATTTTTITATIICTTRRPRCCHRIRRSCWRTEEAAASTVVVPALATWASLAAVALTHWADWVGHPRCPPTDQRRRDAITTSTIRRCSCSWTAPFPRCTVASAATKRCPIAGTTPIYIGRKATSAPCAARNSRGATTWRHTARSSTPTLKIASSATTFTCDRRRCEPRGRTKGNWGSNEDNELYVRVDIIYARSSRTGYWWHSFIGLGCVSDG